jgi:pyruvate/2-oxoglutarate dehydrogenase complex dihydrolipoamide acyltransferase (E2) component
MDRRQVLQLGAALSALPVLGAGGCDATAPPPPPVSAGATPAPAGDPAAPAKPDPAPTAAADASAPAATPASAEPPKTSFTRVVGRLGRNHGHALTVSFADVTAGVEKTYELAGTANHPHAVTLSPDDLKGLLAGKTLRTTSTTTRGHAHRVVVRCAPPVDPPEWVNVCKFSSSGKDEHEIVITAADLSAKATKTYDVQGLAGHRHEVTLSPADFEKLLKGGPVTSHTTRDPDDAHLHTVSIEYHVNSKA